MSPRIHFGREQCSELHVCRSGPRRIITASTPVPLWAGTNPLSCLVWLISSVISATTGCMLGKSCSIGFPSGRSQGGTMLPWFRIGYRASRWAAASVVLGGGLLLDEGADRQGAFVLNVRFRDAKRTKLLKSPAASLASTCRSMRNRYAASAIGVLRCVDRCNNESSVC